MRPLVPRWQTTTLPVAAPTGGRLRQSGSFHVAARTTGLPVSPAVIVTPGLSNVAVPSCRCRLETKKRSEVEAPTLVTHGLACATVAGPGPSLPADALTEMPALNASRNASSTASVYGSLPPEIEKLITSTPSAIACW